MRKAILAGLLLAFASLLSAQTLNNDGVIKMVKAGLSDDVVIAAINGSAPGGFDASPDGLVALKAAGISDRVVTALVTRASASSTPAPHGRLIPLGLKP